MIVTPKAGRERHFAEIQAPGTATLSRLNSNGAEPAALTEIETYQTCEGLCEVNDEGALLTASGRFDRLRFIFRGSPRRWEQIA